MACPRCGRMSSRGYCSACRPIVSEQRRHLNRLDAYIRSENARIERGNRRRRFCLEKILEYLILGDLKRARVWVTKLGAAGFSRSDTREFESMLVSGRKSELEKEVRLLLGLPKDADET